MPAVQTKELSSERWEWQARCWCGKWSATCSKAILFWHLVSRLPSPLYLHLKTIFTRQAGHVGSPGWLLETAFILLMIHIADVAWKQEVGCTILYVQSSKTNLLWVVKPNTTFRGCWGAPTASFFLPAFSRSALVIQSHRTCGGERSSRRSGLRVENRVDKERLVLSLSPMLCLWWVLGVHDPGKVQLVNLKESVKREWEGPLREEDII